MSGVARLDVGQRVYVLRDAFNAPVGAWGTVVRTRFANPGAWVRLDARHERCAFPFPATDETRKSWLLTEPQHCSSVEPDAPQCRRCIECAGQAHHWLTSIPELDPEGGGDPFIPCKHCDARAGICVACDEGAVWPPTTNNQRCEACKG